MGEPVYNPSGTSVRRIVVFGFAWAFVGVGLLILALTSSDSVARAAGLVSGAIALGLSIASVFAVRKLRNGQTGH